jgi:hypothetical protein
VHHLVANLCVQRLFVQMFRAALHKNITNTHYILACVLPSLRVVMAPPLFNLLACLAGIHIRNNLGPKRHEVRRSSSTQGYKISMTGENHNIGPGHTKFSLRGKYSCLSRRDSIPSIPSFGFEEEWPGSRFIGRL